MSYYKMNEQINGDEIQKMKICNSNEVTHACWIILNREWKIIKWHVHNHPFSVNFVKIRTEKKAPNKIRKSTISFMMCMLFCFACHKYTMIQIKYFSFECLFCVWMAGMPSTIRVVLLELCLCVRFFQRVK